MMKLNNTYPELKKICLIALLYFGALCAISFLRGKKLVAYFSGALNF